MSLTESQKEARKGKLGGSDIPAVLGVSPYKTKRQLALEKMGLVDTNFQNRAMLRGSLLEPVIAKLWKEETGIQFSKPTKTLEHPDHPWLVGHFDGLTRNKELIEIKTFNLSKYLKAKREGLPIEITSQVQAYMSWPKIKKAYVIVFSAEIWEYMTVEMEPDPEFQEIIFREGSQFISDLKAGIIPQEDQPDGPIIDLPAIGTSQVLQTTSPEFMNAIAELYEAQAIVKEAVELETSAKAQIQRLMGEYEIAESPGFRVYWKWQNGRTSVDSKALKRDLPDVFTRYAKQGDRFRTFKTYTLGGNHE